MTKVSPCNLGTSEGEVFSALQSHVRSHLTDELVGQTAFTQGEMGTIYLLPKQRIFALCKCTVDI